jgi:hypothetical protein
MGHFWFTIAAVGTVTTVLTQYTLLRACSRAAAQHVRQRRIASTGTAEDCSTSSSCGTAADSSSSKAKAQYSASIADLVSLIRADWALLVCAFTALVLAAVGQVMIPHYTGQMISIVVQGGRAAEFHHAALRLIGAAFGCGERYAISAYISTCEHIQQHMQCVGHINSMHVVSPTCCYGISCLIVVAAAVVAIAATICFMLQLLLDRLHYRCLYCTDIVVAVGHQLPHSWCRAHCAAVDFSTYASLSSYCFARYQYNAAFMHACNAAALLY